MAAPPPTERSSLALLGVLASVAAAALSAWFAMRLELSVSNPRHFRTSWQLIGRTIHHARGAATPSAVGFFISFALILGAGTALIVVLWKATHRLLSGGPKTTSEEGFATREEIARTAGPKALLKRAGTLRPSLENAGVDDLGTCLGRARGVKCYASVEDSMIVVGPPRSGKGMNLIIPQILDSVGPVITTSTRPDNLTVTMGARAEKGPVGIFDPEGLARGLGGSLRWSPVRGCADALTATTRANVLVADATGGVNEGQFWREATQKVVRNLLHAAALEDLGPSDLYRWSANPSAAREAVQILEDNPLAIPNWAEDLASIVLGGDDRMRGNVWAMVSNVFGSLGIPEIAQQFTPTLGDELHPEAFLRENGTLYLLGTATGAATTARFIAALIEDVVKAARTDASSQRGARLDPPLALILDEAANFPLPSITGLMSEGGGTGITTTVVFQSLAQARGRWGRDEADAIWETATLKVILGGGASAQDLRDLAQLIGDRDVKEISYSYEGSGRNASRTESTRQRSIIDVPQLRAIPLGKGLMLLRTSTPIMLALQPWTQRKDADELQRGREQLEDELRASALASMEVAS